MKPVLVVLALVAAVVVPTASAHSPTFAQARVAASDTLQVKAKLATETAPSTCPGGTPAGDVCFQRTGRAAIPGLGTVTETYPVTSADESQSCIPLSVGPVTMTIAGKGTLDASLHLPTSCNVATGTLATFTITGSSGIYAGASGSGTFEAVPSDEDDQVADDDDFGGIATDAWSASLTVQGLGFDLTPPVISGAVSKTVRVAKTAKFARVAFKVAGKDAVDGTVPVSCKPRSGSRFKIGRTKVSCSATDSSANTATARFRITVKRR